MIIVKGRELLIPENERYIGTTYDDNSTVRTFRIPRFHEDGMDKSQLDFYVIINYDDGSDPDAVGVVKAVNDDYIVLEWDVGDDITEHSGCLYLWVRGFDYTGTVRWSSFPGVFYIETSGTEPSDLSDLEERISEEDKLIRLAKLYKSQPMTAATAAEMINREQIYVYVGDEEGYQYGYWYFWDGSAWVPGGVYNSIGLQTDKELIAEDVAADAKAVGRKKVERFATCVDMKASTSLQSGMVCQTAGYYSVNDGGAALYYIMGAAPVDDYYETLQGGLIGVLVVNDAVTPQMFGAKGDGVTDDTAAIQSALNDDSKMCVFMPGKTYKIKDFVRVTRSNKTIIMYGATIDGADEEASSAGATVSIGSPTAQEDIENIAILGGTFIGHVDLENCIGISHAANVAIKDVRTVGGSKGITAQYHCSNIIVDNCDMSNFLRCGISLESGVQNAIVRDANIHDALTTTAPTDVFSFPIGVMCDISRDEYYDAQDYKYNKNILFDNVNISNVHLGILDHADLEQNIAYKNMVISGDGSTSTYGLHAIDYRPESGLKEIDFSGKIDGFTTSFHVIGVKGLFEVDADKSCLMQYCDELEFDNCLFADQVKVQTATKSVTVNNSTFSYDSGNPVIYQQTDENLMAIFNGCKFAALPQENVKSIVNNCTYKSMLVCSDETGEIHPITELHVEAVSVTNSDAIASGSAKEFDFDVSKTGYTPLAIVGVNKYGANAGMLAIAHSYLYTQNAHARIAFANTSGTAITPTQIFAYVLYKKAL